MQCEQCGHVCVTATEKTSEVPELNQISLDLEDVQNRREHYSPLTAQQKMQKGDGVSTSEATGTVAALDEAGNIGLQDTCCSRLRRGHT